ncbi:MAG TPA: acyl-ACP--UDP-N-acetylglucosamine O-acyltransferase [Blastocatellia bacterium]|nr:acyl-ACP--UDP-N-acetylglucosamine O-acyltransferase [Blastocatellia bacterium]
MHATAIVSTDARLGDGVTAGPYAVIEPDVQIGDRTEIRAHAVIKRFTSIGHDCVVHEGAVLGGEPQDVSFQPCQSYLRIGDRTIIREGVSIHRGTAAGSTTRIGDDCFIMANAHVAHDCLLGDHIVIANNVALAGHVSIQSNAFLSGGVVVHQFCRIGRLAMIGGNAKIIQDCLPFIVTDGVPGRASGLNTVGLKRSGISRANLQALKNAYRILLRSQLPLEDALRRMQEMDNSLVNELIDFIRGSKRGFARTQT